MIPFLVALILLPKLSLSSLEDSDWHMIIGGWNDDNEGLTSVELFNWRTGEQCLLDADLPIELSAHTATVLDGQPIICGGFSDFSIQSSCYKFDKDRSAWLQASDLLEATYFAGSALVPQYGWLIFGGNSLTNAQQLNTASGKWKLGPDLFQRENEIGQCVVQVNDKTTAFLGGSNDAYAIVTLNWSSMTYTRHPTELHGQRSHSFCATVKSDQTGQPLVAVAGGRGSGGRGLEIFNPEDGSVTLVSETLPQEDESGLQLQNAYMIDVQDKTELLVYGGYDGISTQDDIWKFKMADKSWSLAGKMLVPRDDHVVLPVSGLKC